MRKIAAILLLALLFFNWYGYRCLLAWLQQKANVQLEAKLDKNAYNESSLIELDIPLNLPYQTDSKNFERCNGEIVLNGILYKYVKRRIHNGSLILKCIPNETEHRIATVRNEFFKIVNDLQPNNCGTKNQKAPATTFSKYQLGDFDNEQYFDISLTKYLLSIRNNTQHLSIKSCLVHSTPEQPPEV